jgi:hypothetical protein
MLVGGECFEFQKKLQSDCPISPGWYFGFGRPLILMLSASKSCLSIFESSSAGMGTMKGFGHKCKLLVKQQPNRQRRESAILIAEITDMAQKLGQLGGKTKEFGLEVLNQKMKQ